MEAEIETEKEIEIEVSADVFASIAFPSCTCLLIRLAFVCVRFYSFFYCSWFTILCFRCTAMWFRFFLWVFFADFVPLQVIARYWYDSLCYIVHLCCLFILCLVVLVGKKVSGSFAPGVLDHGQHSAHPLPAVVPLQISNQTSAPCLLHTMGNPAAEGYFYYGGKTHGSFAGYSFISTFCWPTVRLFYSKCLWGRLSQR